MCMCFGYNPENIFSTFFLIYNLVSFRSPILSKCKRKCVDSGVPCVRNSSHMFMPIFF